MKQNEERGGVSGPILICEISSYSASKSLHSLHKVHVELQTLERKLSSSEKRLSVPIYPELDVNMDEKMVEEENNLLGGDVERLNGKVPTVSVEHLSYIILTSKEVRKRRMFLLICIVIACLGTSE